MHLRNSLLLLLLPIAPRLAAAQIGSTTDIITGTVRNTSNRPVPNARVEVTSVETGITRIRTTNEKGQYTLLLPDGVGQYRVTARAMGLAPATDNLTGIVRVDQQLTEAHSLSVRGNSTRPAFDIKAMARRLAPNPTAPLMDLKDIIKLTPEQLTTITAIGDSLDAKTGELTKRLEAEMQKQVKAGGDMQTLFPKLQPMLQEARNNHVAATQSLKRLLTPEQWAEVPEAVKNPTLRAGGGQGGRWPDGGAPRIP